MGLRGQKLEYGAHHGGGALETTTAAPNLGSWLES